MVAKGGHIVPALMTSVITGGDRSSGQDSTVDIETSGNVVSSGEVPQYADFDEISSAGGNARGSSCTGS